MRRLFLILGVLLSLTLTTSPPTMADAVDDCKRGKQAYETKDFKEAVKWFRKAAEQGRASAQYNLGLMYQNGEGVVKNDREAVKWFRKAAEQGHAFAQYNLGVMYQNGEGVGKKDLLSINEAADLNQMLANIIASADNNNKEAYKWYLLAAAQGAEVAKESAAYIEKRLTSEDRQAAQDEAAALQAEIEARQ